jgi:hypothetical protein
MPGKQNKPQDNTVLGGVFRRPNGHEQGPLDVCEQVTESPSDVRKLEPGNLY